MGSLTLDRCGGVEDDVPELQDLQSARGAVAPVSAEGGGGDAESFGRLSGGQVLHAVDVERHWLASFLPLDAGLMGLAFGFGLVGAAAYGGAEENTPRQPPRRRKRPARGVDDVDAVHA
ncbi:hypothetical protein [Streptomyces althioticus]|uniref:hypothetical protein n=1 Tax=Streptomyces althioticus TaxID=83380 RepID=UPI0033319D5B